MTRPPIVKAEENVQKHHTSTAMFGCYDLLYLILLLYCLCFQKISKDQQDVAFFGGGGSNVRQRKSSVCFCLELFSFFAQFLDCLLTEVSSADTF